MKKLTDLEIEREKPKQETLEEFINYTLRFNTIADKEVYSQLIREGAKWQQERSYIEEDLEVAFFEGQFGKYIFNDWIRQFKKK